MLIIVAFIRYETKIPDRVEFLVKSWTAGAIVMAVVTLIGVAVALAGWNNPLVVIYENYPYFGTVIRAKGFTGGANSLVYVCLLPLLYRYRRFRLRGKGLGWLMALLAVCAATISKDLLLVGLGLVLVDPYISGRFRPFKVVMITAAALCLWFGTHYIVQRPNDVTGTYLEGTQYTSERVVYRTDAVQLLETSYTALKKAGVSVALKYPLAGVGPGRFNYALPREKSLGNYPEHLPDYDPHSTWIGGFSETGLPGGLSLLLLAGATIWYTRGGAVVESVRLSSYYPPIRVFILMLLIASVSMDVMNFRHLWVPVGLLFGVTLLGRGQRVTGSQQ